MGRPSGTGGNGPNGTIYSGGLYGAGGGGSSQDPGTGDGRGAAGANGVIRIVWGTDHSWPNNNAP